MNYSFIQPKEKPLFFQDTKVWIAFTMVAIIIMVAFNYFLILQTSIAQENIKLYKIKKQSIQDQINFLKKKIENTQLRINFAQNIHSNNIVAKDSIENLFDLIPEKITLTKIAMTQEKLIIKGITPTKDVYNFLLSIPLKSIFKDSTVSFYLTDNGYKFTSVNIFEVKKQ